MAPPSSSIQIILNLIPLEILLDIFYMNEDIITKSPIAPINVATLQFQIICNRDRLGSKD